eukprot:392707-Pyramimonas_sp.AAC.1
MCPLGGVTSSGANLAGAALRGTRGERARGAFRLLRSNAVNVFLGIGIPWSIAAIYANLGDHGDYISRSCGFGLSVGVYCVFAMLAVGMLTIRRHFCGGELGGEHRLATLSSGALVMMWLIYIIISSLRAYDHIGDIWTINSDAPAGGLCK